MFVSVWRERSTFAFIVLYFMCTSYCFPSQPARTFILYLFFCFSSSCLFYILSLLPLTFHTNPHHFASFLPLSPVLFPPSRPPIVLSVCHFCRPFCLPLLSILAPQERNAVIFLLLTKPPVENIGLIKVKGKGLKRKVFHASCEWYAGTENGKVPSLCFFFFRSSFTM